MSKHRLPPSRRRERQRDPGDEIHHYALGEDFEGILFGDIPVPNNDDDETKVMESLLVFGVFQTEHFGPMSPLKRRILDARRQMEAAGYPDTILGRTLEYVKEKDALLRRMHIENVVDESISKSGLPVTPKIREEAIRRLLASTATS